MWNIDMTEYKSLHHTRGSWVILKWGHVTMEYLLIQDEYAYKLAFYPSIVPGKGSTQQPT